MNGHSKAAAGPLALLVAALWLMSAFTAQAHKPSDSYLSLKIDAGRVTGQWDIALRDLEYALGLDTNDDGLITAGELRARQNAVTAYALARCQVRSAQILGTIRITEQLVDFHSDGAYAVLRFELDEIFAPAELELEYRAFFDLDPQHRGLLRLDLPGGTKMAIFSPDHPRQRFDLAPARSGQGLVTFVGEGMRHIWLGFDHILFLLALLFSSVLRREGGRWVEVASARSAFANVLKLVTAFTIAHSVTLTLATLGIVKLPTRLVESSIAASVVLAAASNFYPVFDRQVWPVAFGFGLVHGFGFANVLGDLGLQHGILARTLLGFNLGVELGQLVIVLVFVPVAFGLRRSWFYQQFTFKLGSATIALVAAVWMGERLFDFKLLPF
jgi:hypothetical protein